MVAHQAELSVTAHHVDAELGLRAVSDHVSQAVDLVHLLIAQVFEHRVQRLSVGVEV